MGRGRKRADLPADDPDQFVSWVQRGRRRWDADLVPALLAWFLMQEEHHKRVRADLMGKHHGMSKAVLEGVVNRLDGVIDAIRTLSAVVTEPWRRVDWEWAVGQVTREGRVQEEPEQPEPTT